jgi:phosphoglycolate phosphatase
MTHFPLAILFDLDGTLVDTAPDLLASLNAVLTRAGHRPVKPTELRSMVGHGVRALFERAFKETGTPVSAADLARYSDEFMAHYRENIARESRPFPGVPETLKRLADEGAKLGVCSNKPQELTDLLLAQLDLARHFGAVYGGGKAAHNKPAPDHVLELVDALEGSRGRAVLIGDSTVDVAAARAAGIPVIVMSYGYTQVSASELGADAVADDFSALPELISRLADYRAPRPRG